MHLFSATIWACVVGVVIATLPNPQQPQDPVIGIMTDPLSQCKPAPSDVQKRSNACVESIWPRWLEAAGVRVVPFPWNATETYQRWLAKRVNGILFPGGWIAGREMTEYFDKIQMLLRWAREWNREGDPFVLWGTCQGFQLLSAAAAGTRDVIVGPYEGMCIKMMPLNFTKAQPHSRMFGDATTPSNIRAWLTHKPTTVNWHQYIVPVEAYTRYPKLRAFFKPVAVNNVPNSTQQFVSAVEAFDANIYGVQFHPERPPFHYWDDHITHTAEDNTISQFMSSFLASRLRKNNHTFDTPEQFEALRLSKWPLVSQGWGVRTYYVQDPPQ